MQKSLILYTTIRPSLLRRTLWKGFIIALIGVLPLVYVGAFFNLVALTIWGFFTFILSLGLISFGLLPYRRLLALTNKPDRLAADDALEYESRGKTVFSFPITEIARLSYLEEDDIYGICLWLKPEFRQDILFSDELNIQSKTRKKAGSDFFIPYFSRRSYNELQEWLIVDSSDEK